jgi:hypothetical protein
VTLAAAWRGAVLAWLDRQLKSDGKAATIFAVQRVPAVHRDRHRGA